MRPAFLVFLSLISFTWLPAQTSVSGPVEAVTFDPPTRSVRAVIGLPGAASFGPALLDNLDLASVAPGQNYGIVFEGGRCLFVTGLGSKKIGQATIENARTDPQGVAWAAGGSLAILYSVTGNWFQLVTGLPAAPVAGTVVESASLGGVLSGVASDASGEQIAVAVSGAEGGVYLYSNGQFARQASLNNPVSLSFSTDAKTLYALDAATPEVTAITLANDAFQSFALAGMSNPIAIQASLNASGQPVVYIAGGTDRSLRTLDLASGQFSADVALLFQPTGIAPFGATSFVLAGRSQAANPLWLLSNSASPAAYFVPAVQLRSPVPRLNAGRVQ
jgi:hypothetical protein